MARDIILSPRVQPYRSATVHAVRAAGLVFVSGVTPWRGPRDVAKGDFVAQLHQVMANLIAILEDAGSGLQHAVKVNVALTDMGRYYEFDPIYASYFPAGDFPARMTTESPRLPHPDHLLSIDCIATLAVNPA